MRVTPYQARAAFVKVTRSYVRAPDMMLRLCLLQLQLALAGDHRLPSEFRSELPDDDGILSDSHSAPPVIDRRQTGVRRPLSNQMSRQQPKNMWYKDALYDDRCATAAYSDEDETTNVENL